MLNGHKPVTIDKFNGLWRRGDVDNTPIDHFSDCNNIRFIGTAGFATRYGVDISQDVSVPLSNVRRFYNYPTPTGNTLIVLVINEDDEGEIYHVVNSTTVYGPLLTIEGMKDFGFFPYAGRAYITPFAYYEVTGLDDQPLNIEKGMDGEFLYVYMGNGTAARKAAGNPLTGNMTIANGSAGNTDPGLHLFGWVAETDSGYLTAPGAIEAFTTAANFSVSFTVVPTSGSPTIVKRHLVATKVITGYTGNTTGYQFFFVPGATIPNDTDTFLLNQSFFDIDLLEDASYLLDNYAEIPAGVSLSSYHNRMILTTTFDDISIALVSAPGEPEAISQVDGLIVVPLDGNPITNAAELRDVLYIFKRARTVAYVDNGDVPSSWPMTDIDAALGTCVHGIATVLDSGSQSVDSLIVANYAGMYLFNGSYIVPELSWKIQDFWFEQDRNLFRLIQVLNEPISAQIICVIPDGRILIGDYANGMNAKNIRWTPTGFPRNINTVAIVNIDQIILGMDLL